MKEEIKLLYAKDKKLAIKVAKALGYKIKANGRFKEEIKDSLYKTVTILSNLDYKLSNAYTGNPKSDHDKAIKYIRKLIENASNELSSHKWLPYLKKLI